MEMPTPCNNCGEIFELHDGRRSPRGKAIMICEACADEEQEEIDREEEIQELKDQISDAEYTLKAAKERLADFLCALFLPRTGRSGNALLLGYELH